MLSNLLISETFAFLLVFCRLGSALMLMPGFGESYVAVRVRLLLAVMISLLVAPIAPGLPAPPATAAALAGIVIAEILVGLFLGGITRMLIATIHMAGTIIAFQSSLASALVNDVTQVQGQASALGNFLSVVGVLLIFSMNLHHMMLQTLADSYTLFPAGVFPIVGDFADHAARTMNGAFVTAMQMAAPHIVMGLVFYLGTGILSRLVPNVQVFFVVIPPHLLLSFFVLMICFSSIMLFYTEYFRAALGGFLAP